ncbi:MAG: hypothetical protein Q8R60_10025 [Mycobacteriales bacterium]|nr:hypothetical protein [Mycobacteriales bacterium]
MRRLAPRLLTGLAVTGLLLVGLTVRDGSAHGPRASVPQLGSTASPTAGSVTVIGVPGLRWSDVDPTVTPTLHALARSSAVGSLSVKARPSVSCAADGFLTLGAGNRAEAFGVACGSAPTAAELPELRRRNAATRDGAQVGLLGSALPATDCITWNGPLSFAAHGRRAVFLGGGTSSDEVPGAPIPLRSTAGAQGGLGSCRLAVLEATVVGADGSARRAAAAAADALVREVRAATPPTGALLVVGVSEAPTDDDPHLHVAIGSGPGFAPGALRSASTRRDAMVQLVDVAPTVLSLLGVAVPDDVIGQPMRVSGSAPTLAELVDTDRLATTEADVRVPFFVVYLGVLLLLLGALWRRRQVARVVALTGALVPVASYAANLLPWWRTGAPLVSLLALSVGLALAVALPVSRLRGRLAAVAVVLLTGTAVVLADLLTGATLQLSSVAGYSPLVAGRFAGIGNVAFGVLAACAVLGVAATRSAPAAVLVGGLVAVVDGAPPWGSDVGGVLALAPAYAVLVLRLAGRRVSVLRVGLAGVVGAATVAAFAVADSARPPDERTHLGRFAQQVVDGEAGRVLRRKAEAVFGLLFHSPVTALLPLLVAAVVLLVVRPPAPLRVAFDDAPAWRSGLVALGVACLIGFALNDSGAAVPALALVVALPATAAVVLSGAPRREGVPDR